MKAHTFVVLAGLTLVSCSSNPPNASSSKNDRSSIDTTLSKENSLPDSGLSIIDMLEGECLRKNIDSIIGTDSAGIAAKEYICIYENGLGEIFSHYPDLHVMIGRNENLFLLPSPSNNHDLAEFDIFCKKPQMGDM